MSERFHAGNIVQHFKRELLNDEERAAGKYLYKIIGFATHTETGEKLVFYQELYSNEENANYNIYARPYDMFIDEVDRSKYPGVEQKHRFELYADRF